MRSLRSIDEESWPLAAPPAPADAGSHERTIYLDEPEEPAVTVTVTVERGDEVVLKETIRL